MGRLDWAVARCTRVRSGPTSRVDYTSGHNGYGLFMPFRLTLQKIIALLGGAVVIAGQWVLKDYLGSVGHPNSVIDTFFATLGLFKFSLPTDPEIHHVPGMVQVLRIVAPIATTSTIVGAFQRGARHNIDLAVAGRWKGHQVVIGQTELARLFVRSAETDPGTDRTVFAFDRIDDDLRLDLRFTKTRVCLLPMNSPSLKNVVGNAAVVRIDAGSDDSSVQWAATINGLFADDPDSAPSKVLVYVSNSELLRLRDFLGRNFRFTLKAANLATEALQLSQLMRGARGPLNVVIVADDPQVIELIDAIKRQLVKVAESARITLITNLPPDRIASDPSLNHVLVENIDDTQRVADHLRRIKLGIVEDGYGDLANPIFLWPRNAGDVVPLIPMILDDPGQRVVIVSTSESARHFTFDGNGRRNISQRLTVVTNGFLLNRGMLGTMPDQASIALGLHARHLTKFRAGSDLVMMFPFDGGTPVPWEECVNRDFYFGLADDFLRALADAGLTIAPGPGATTALSNETMLATASSLCRIRNISFDITDHSRESLMARYGIMDLVASLPAMFGPDLHLAGTDTGVALSTEDVDRLGMAIHADYLAKQNERTDTNTSTYSIEAMWEWADLKPRLREASLEQARSIPLKLAALGVRILRGESDWRSDDTTPELLEILSEIEHRRWCEALIERGFVHGEIRDDVERTHPDLRPYSLLESETREKDRRSVSQMSEFLRVVGLGCSLA